MNSYNDTKVVLQIENLTKRFGNLIAVKDLSPSTHAVVALNKVLTLSGDMHEVTYKLSMRQSYHWHTFWPGSGCSNGPI